MSNLKKLFNPGSIAVVGASQESGKVGNVITKNLLELGYTGKVFFVNPKHDKIYDQRSYKSLGEIAEKIDLAIIVLPAKIVVPVIRESAGRVKNFVVISAGFSETDEEGREREKELEALAVEKELNILGPNCLGFIIPKLNLNASFAGGMPKAGNVSFVSQSGALAVAIMDIARKENIKFSNIISVGNKMRIDEAEILEYLSQDEGTKVIGMYLEGIKNGPKFIRVAQKVSRIKPIIIIKAGKTEKAQQAISSHTGALAGSDDIMDAVFEKTGVLRAENLADLFALIELVSNTQAPKTNQVAVVTNAGGPGVLTTDAFGGKEIKLGDPNDGIKNKLREFLPAESSVANPIDLLGDAMEDRYAQALDVLDSMEGLGALVCVLTPQDQTPVSKIADRIIAFRDKTDKLVATIFIGGERVERSVAKLKENGIPNFSFPDLAVRAINEYYAWNRRRTADQSGAESAEPIVVDASRQENIAAIIGKAREEKRGALSFPEAQKIMAMYGIKTPSVTDIGAGDSLPEGIGFPAVMKVDSDKVLHKTDKQGVILNIKNREELEKAYAQMEDNFPGERFIIQPMLAIKTELIAGIKIDGIFGPIVVYGLGGIYTEVFKMVDFLVSPGSIQEVKASLAQGKLKFLFEKTRGQAPYDIEGVSKILFGLSLLAREAAEIKELDINPLLVYNDGKEAVAVDVKIII
ncbi:MAG: acetate--CoA ligase family protein [Candidatus Moranbacteria bacterium]|nr:acetate--CoA ligase family protein [Candidatus Moranbacteria bacterium]